MAQLRFSRHALDRMLDWQLDVEEVRAGLESGETIEEYEDGARLLLGRAGIEPLHIVVRDDQEEVTFVITVYRPDPTKWDPQLRRRIEP